MSNITTQQAIAQVKRFQQFIEAFKHLELVAEELLKADQLVLEAEKRKQKIDATTQECTDQLGVIERRIEQARQALAEVVADAEAQRVELLEETNKKAEGIIEAAQQERSEINAEIAEIQAKHEETSNALAEVDAEYTRVSKKLAKAREAIRAFVSEDG